MEELSPIWFLKHPIDFEQKSYILLHKLNSYKNKLKKGQVGNTINEILSIIKDLNYFKLEGKLTENSYKKLTLAEIQIINYYSNLEKDDVEYSDLYNLINRCLDILYRYVNISIGLFDEDNNMITFEIVPHSESEVKPKFGFFLIRNMVTDEIIPYFWSESKMEDADGINRIGVGMKRINLKEPLYFSLSYINIIHEIIENTGDVSIGETPRILICEISENFKESSDIIKDAKLIFLEKLSNEKKKFI